MSGTGRLRGLRWLAPALVLGIAAVLRFWALSRPDALVFDELYYVRDAISQLAHGFPTLWPDDDPDMSGGRATGFTDAASNAVHPPLGKWLIGIGVLLFGPGTGWGWRSAVALAGVATVAVVMRLGWLLSRSLVIACTAGLLLAIDGVHVVLTRVGLLDGFLTLFVALGALFVWRDGESVSLRSTARARSAGSGRIAATATGSPPVRETAPPRDDQDAWRLILWRRPWLLAAGAAFGAAAAIKWSGLYPLAFFLVYITVRDLLARLRAAQAARTARTAHTAGGADCGTGSGSDLADLPGAGANTEAEADADADADAESRVSAAIGGDSAPKSFSPREEARSSTALREEARSSTARQAGAWCRTALQALVTAAIALPTAGVVYLASWAGWILQPGGWGRTPGTPWPVALARYHAEMLGWHSTLSAPHPYQSHPLSWPFALVPTAMYKARWTGGCPWAECVSTVSPLPNPLVTWGGVLALIVLGVLVVRRLWIGRGWGRHAGSPRPAPDPVVVAGAFVITGYLSGWLPWVLTFSRSAVFQFYAVVLTPFSALALALLLGMLCGIPLRSRGGTENGLRLGSDPDGLRGRRIAVALFIAVAVALAALFFPAWSGMPVAEWFWRAHLWLPGWG